MTRSLEALARLLPGEDREAILGDICESGLLGLLVDSILRSLSCSFNRMRLLRSRFFIAELVPRHVDQIKRLRALKIDWPRSDSIYDHVYANQALTRLLNEYGIEHEAEEFNGIGQDDAYWGKGSRITKEVLPFLGEHLDAGQQ
jgi:hypothetical protein